ncbi:MAG: alpha-L-fucosidase C-terminal domain-containing protein [Bacteroidota bacterium]|nr:alpha-L-fucosidase C-terminal domain-containing protein [Bacteroidota bacterium]
MLIAVLIFKLCGQISAQQNEITTTSPDKNLIFSVRLKDVGEKIKGMPGGKLDKIHADFTFSTKDFRFTEGKDGSVYAFCMTVPKAGETIRIKSMGKNSGLVNQNIQQVTLLGSNSKLTWTQEDSSLKIICPDKMDFSHVACFKIQFQGTSLE